MVVIPGRDEVASPESIVRQSWWMNGFRARATRAPEWQRERSWNLRGERL